MDDTQLLQRLDAQDAQLEEIQKAVKSTQRYFRITFWITIVLFVLPLVAMVFVIPWAFSSYLGSFSLDSGNTNSSQDRISQELELIQDLLK